MVRSETTVDDLCRAHVAEAQRRNALVKQLKTDAQAKLGEKPGKALSAPAEMPHWLSKTKCQHTWQKVENCYGIFRRCLKCKYYRLSKREVGEKIRLDQLPPVLKGKRLPGTTHYDIDIILVDDFIRLRRSTVFIDEWSILVRFPKGWVTTGGFGTMDYDRVTRLLQKMQKKTDDPVRIFEALMRDIYGHPAQYRYQSYL